MEITVKSVDLSEYTTRVYQSGVAITYNHVRAARKKNRNNELNLKKNNRSYQVHRGKLRAACCSLMRNKHGYCLLFITITLPFAIPEVKAAKAWKIMLDQFRNQYKCNGYVWVKEYQKNGNVHYHILLDKAYIPIEKLQKTWNNAINHVTGIMPETNCSVRLGSQPRVFSIKKVKYYLSKYVTKEPAKMDGKQYEKYEALKALGITDGLFLCKSYGHSFLKLYFDVLPAFNSDLLHDMFAGSKMVYSCDYYSVYSLFDKNKYFRLLVNEKISAN